MTATRRTVPLLVVGGLALILAGCGSNNEGKIVGRWKMVSGPGIDEQAK